MLRKTTSPASGGEWNSCRTKRTRTSDCMSCPMRATTVAPARQAAARARMKSARYDGAPVGGLLGSSRHIRPGARQTAGAPCRPSPPANRAAPSAVSPLAMTARPRRDLVAQGGVQWTATTARTPRGGRCAGSVCGSAASSWARVECGVERAAIGHDAVGEADGQRLGRADCAPGEDHVERTPVADEPGQPDGAAVHERDAEAAAEDAEDGALRGHAEVAPERDLQAAGDGVALDGGDDRLAEQKARDAQRGVPVLGGTQRADGAQVGAGAERATSAGENGDGRRVVGVEVPERAGQCRRRLPGRWRCGPWGGRWSPPARRRRARFARCP